MDKRRIPLSKEKILEIIKRHEKIYKKLAKDESCEGCGCTPCDCGWGND